MPYGGARKAAAAGRLAKQQGRVHSATLAHRFRARAQPGLSFIRAPLGTRAEEECSHG